MAKSLSKLFRSRWMARGDVHKRAILSSLNVFNPEAALPCLLSL